MQPASAAIKSADRDLGRVTNIAEYATLFALLVAAVTVLWWRWVGYQGHDDESYATAALAWVNHFPPLGTTHWALRYPLVLPIAGAIAVLGPTVLALASANLVAYTAFLIVSYAAVRHWFGWPTAAILTVINIILPEFPVQATYANPDLLEMTLTVGSFWALMFGRDRNGAASPLIVSGILAGLGFMTRETSLILVILYGLLFLFRPGMKRWRYFLIAAGFLLVVGTECTYFAVRTGDPLYRTRISANHDHVDRSAKISSAEKAGHALDNEGVLATNPILEPVVALFVSQKYGLLFYLALPAYWLLRRSRWMTQRQRSVVNCAALGALVAFLFVALNFEILYIVPRYFIVPAALAAVPVAVVITRLFDEGGMRRTIALLVGAAFIATSLGLLYLEDTQPMLAESRIAAFVATSGSIVHVDPETERRLQYLLRAPGLLNRVTTLPPGSDSLVATEAGVVSTALANPAYPYRAQMQPFAPRPDWTVVDRFEPPHRGIAPWLDRLGLLKLIPPDILRKIERPGNTGIIYRTGDTHAS